MLVKFNDAKYLYEKRPAWRFINSRGESGPDQLDSHPDSRPIFAEAAPVATLINENKHSDAWYAMQALKDGNIKEAKRHAIDAVQSSAHYSQPYGRDDVINARVAKWVYATVTGDNENAALAAAQVTAAMAGHWHISSQLLVKPLS